MNLNQQVLDAIELLAKSSVERAGYDKTIQAQIISCEDPTIGKYKCKFQDAVFYAYTGNTDITLSNGAYVYILIPENDMTKDKTILGTIDKLGTNYISAAVGDQAYTIIGTNCIKTTNYFYLDTNNQNYSFNLYQQNVRNLVDLNVQQFNKYIKESSSLIVGAKIKTQIDSNKQYQGHYGLSVILQFIDEDSNLIQRTYTVNEDNMIDNPYNLIYPTRQYAIYDIDGQHFNKIKSISIFNSDFPNATGDISDTLLVSGDIRLSELELKCAIHMTEEELNGLALSLFTPNGIIFLNSTDSSKIIQAQVKVKGKVVTATDNIEFYYGIEDVGVTSKSEYYNKNLGSGWRCLNDFNIITGTDPNEDPLVDWTSHNDTFTFSFEEAKAYDNRIKVAAIYDGNIITKEINIQNLTLNPDFIKITSSAGTKFYYGMGVTTLTCQVLDSSYTNLSYKWAWQNNGGLLQSIVGTSNDFIQNINENVLTNVQVRKIYNFGIFKCSVYNNDVLIGTALIRLSNSMEGEATSPLIINNGTALFKYNEKGVAPNGKGLQNPQQIQSLSFVLYDDIGNPIEIVQNGLIDARAKVRWVVPNKDTLLSIPNISPSSFDDNYNYYDNQATLTYDIASRYDADKINNQIKLYVTYEGATSIAKTAFTFTKEGNIGTNGTQYYVKIIPNTLLQSPPEFPMITKLGSSQQYALNYGLNNGNQETIITSSISNQNLLKVQVWRSDQKVYETGWSGSVISPTIEWSILKNHYWGTGANRVDDESDFSITSAGAITYTNSLQSGTNLPKANIIKCTITYENKNYYGTIPFITAYVTNQNYRVQLKKNTGFHYVLYSSDGMSPEYDNKHPFEFIFKNNGEQITSGITYTSAIKGNTKYRQNNTTYTRDSNNLQQLSVTGLEANQFKYQPTSRYFGECVNNSIQCSYQQSSTFVGIINIPIHFLLNKYGLGNINAWDGNSVQINQEDGYILAPQMGAGQKNSYNQFTGVLMGRVEDPGKNQRRIGLFGYANGNRTFFLNSQNGSAIFGGQNKTESQNKSAQIIIDPAATNARIYSGDFYTNYDAQTGLPNSYSESNYANAGMLIDLTTPQIVFKNKMFWIDQNGSIKAGKQNTNNWNFSVDALTGNVNLIGTITAKSGFIGDGGSNSWTIGGANDRAYIYSGNKDTLSSTNKGIYIGTDGVSVRTTNKETFKIDSSGNVTIDGSITMGSGSTINWGAVSQNNGIATLNGDFSDPTKTAGIVAQNADDALNGVEALANGTYENGTFINGDMIISPTIIADSFYAQPETITSPHTSGHFILQSPKSISGETITWQNVLDITYGYDSFRPFVEFFTAADGDSTGYFKFRGGQVQCANGINLPAAASFLNQGDITCMGGIVNFNTGKIILREYNQYWWDSSNLPSNPTKGQLCFIIDSNS